jgi:hypothetical protein
VLRRIEEAGALPDAVVRVIVRLHQEQEALLVEREVMRALEGAYFVASLQRDVQRRERQRLGGLSVEELTPAQLLERYLEQRELPQERARLLLQRGEALIKAVDEGEA